MEFIPSIFDGQLISWQGLPSRRMIFGQSESMRGLRRIVERVANTNVPILILGEKGIGKDVLARFIHSCCPGPDAPFMKVTPPISDADAVNEMAFRVEKEEDEDIGDLPQNENSSSRMCTLFVEEVGEMGPGRQLELLRLIQGSRSFIMSGGLDIPITLRVIATSTSDLGEKVGAGDFLEDLLALLSVVTLRLSPLRERKEDIAQLANYFWQVYSERYGCRSEAPIPEFIRFLQEQEWRGNIRELENFMKRYVVLGAESALAAGDTFHSRGPLDSGNIALQAVSLKQATREAAHALERKIILRTLQQTQWNRRRTARALNISYRALLYKIKEAGLNSEQPEAVIRESASRGQKVNRGIA